MNNATPLPMILPETKLNLGKSDKLLHLFEDIHNHMYANDGLSSQQSFEEMLKILFVKIFDEKKKNGSAFYITPPELENILGGKKSKDFSDRISKLEKDAADFFSDVIERNDEIKLKQSSLAYIVNKLQHINLSDSSRDVKGLAFQKFVYNKQRSDRGQFFTPEQVVDLCVRIIKPRRGEKILDPACGSAGFLSQAMKYVLKHSNVEETQSINKIGDDIFGFEINKMAAKTAKMRMILDGDGSSNIIVTDSLSDWDNLNFDINKTCNIEDKTYEDYFDVILTNPPFGSQGKVTNKSSMEKFNLAHKWAQYGDTLHKTDILHNGQVPDILFIERCLDLLKYGGRMAIVLPNGDLENSSLDYVRYYINENTKVLAVVNLPFDTFIPFGTGVKASVLFLQKMNKETLSEEKANNYKIFFGKINKLGYLGNKNGSPIYKKDPNGKILIGSNGEPLIDEDVTEVVSAYDRFVSGELDDSGDDCFAVNFENLSSRLDHDYYKPSYRKMEEALKKYGAKRLGDVIKLRKQKSLKLKRRDLEVEYVELSDVNTEYNEINGALRSLVYDLPSRASYELKQGDVVTAVAGNSIGTSQHASAFVTEKFDGAICTNGFRILNAGSDIDPFYLLYYLKSDYFLKQVYKYRTGAAIPAISDEDLLNILIYIPPKEVQQDIVKKVRESFELRRKSKELLSNVCIGI